MNGRQALFRFAKVFSSSTIVSLWLLRITEVSVLKCRLEVQRLYLTRFQKNQS